MPIERRGARIIRAQTVVTDLPRSNREFAIFDAL
jgi:hypothetical protein